MHEQALHEQALHEQDRLVKVMSEFSLYRGSMDLAPWNDRLQMLEVVSVEDEAAERKTCTLRRDNQIWFRYQPGQFITRELPEGPEPLLRIYTLASSPSRRFSVAVTVKVQAGSIGTCWMFDRLKPGMRIKAYGPAGNFSLHTHPGARYLFLSAGSGITPMMSMLRWLNDCFPQTSVTMVNCARWPDELLFRRELELIGSRMPGLSLVFLAEEKVSLDSWFGLTGRIDAKRLPLLCPDLHEREIFCCGPEPFMSAVCGILEAAHVDMTHYHQESFATTPLVDIPVEFSVPFDLGDKPASEHLNPIRFTLSDVDVHCAAGQSVLQMARASGVRSPAACKNGL